MSETELDHVDDGFAQQEEAPTPKIYTDHFETLISEKGAAHNCFERYVKESFNEDVVATKSRNIGEGIRYAYKMTRTPTGIEYLNLLIHQKNPFEKAMLYLGVQSKAFGMNGYAWDLSHDARVKKDEKTPKLPCFRIVFAYRKYAFFSMTLEQAEGFLNEMKESVTWDKGTTAMKYNFPVNMMHKWSRCPQDIFDERWMK